MDLISLIETLGAFPPDMPVTLKGRSGIGVTSWRGIYEQPTLVFGDSTVAKTWHTNSDYGFDFEEPDTYHDLPAAETVGALLAALKAVQDGGGLCGYKGGVYTARDSAPVWADPYGDATGIQVVGVADDGGTVVLATAQREAW